MTRSWEENTVVATYDPVEVNLPGELAAPDPWEEVCEADCSACFERCTPGPFGLCCRCAARYRLLGAGCGQAVALVAALDGGDGVPVAILDHLIRCPGCHAYLSGLVEAVRVADMENAHARSLAAFA